jgi:diguanylate cyclase (GGDEF)-like protein/PAS domain S-box-containing protein
VIKLGLVAVDKENMTRPRSDVSAPVPDEALRAARTRGQNVAAIRPLGEIISIRSATPPQQEEALRESEARLRALLSSLDDLVFEIDENGVYLAIWTTNETLLVAPPNELLGRTVREALGGEVGRRVTRAVRRAIDTGRTEILEYRLDVPAGARCFQARIAPISESAPPTTCLLVRDITDYKTAEAAREDAERRLRHLATHDALTDLPNRTFFRERLDLALRKAQRSHEELVVLVLDVDRFKAINDTFGHLAGDEVLREVARRLVAATPEGDSVARLGGDEFAILLPGASQEEGASVARRVSERFKIPVGLGNDTVKVEVSTGLAIFPGEGTDAESLFRRADAAMYAVKKAHRARRTRAET